MLKVNQASRYLGYAMLMAFVCGCAPDVDDGATTASKEQEMPAADGQDAAAEEAPLEDLTPTVPAEPGAPAPTPSTGGPTLTIGDPAPALEISQYVMGAPVQKIEPGQVYVVEFWATWCGPCRTSMPHMSQLQQSYGDQVTMIGITREEAPVVEEFLAQEQSEGVTWKEAITYRLALDKNDATSTAYMRAANQNGIPTAFIVGKDSVVEWIGHPMSMDQPLEEIVNGTWDRQAAVAEMQAEQRLQELSIQLRSLQQQQKWDEALAIVEELEQELGENTQLLYLKAQMLGMAGKPEEAKVARQQAVDTAWDDASMLNSIAWSTAVNKSSEEELGLAQKAAERASELTDDSDASVLDTLARVYYEQGDLDKAIEWQQKAVDNAEGNASVTKTLEKYQAEKEEQ